MAITWRQRFSRRFPPVLRRTVALRPLEQGTGATPARMAKAWASRHRRRLPACPTSPAATTVETP